LLLAGTLIELIAYSVSRTGIASPAQILSGHILMIVREHHDPASAVCPRRGRRRPRSMGQQACREPPSQARFRLRDPLPAHARGRRSPLHAVEPKASGGIG